MTSSDTIMVTLIVFFAAFLGFLVGLPVHHAFHVEFNSMGDCIKQLMAAHAEHSTTTCINLLVNSIQN